jgi:uncharacterized membrane protein
VAAFGMPVVGAQMRGATAETRPVLFQIAKGLSTVARAGLGLLIITGPILFWTKWSGSAPAMGWFIAKMVLVLILLAGVIYSGINGNRAAAGDMAAAKRAPQLGMINMAALIGIVLCAVFAFN